MASKANMRSQIDAISAKVHQAEKAAEKQVKQFLKSTESFRSKQLKNVQQLVRRARMLKQGNLVQQAEKVRKDVESFASDGLDLVLHKLKVPTRKEVDRLNKRVSTLQKQIDEMGKTKGGSR